MTHRLLAAAAAMLAAGTASAQYQMVNPWVGDWNRSGPPQVGTLPNGTPVVNPWVRPMAPSLQSAFAQQYAYQNAMAVWNPTLAQYWQQTGNYSPFGVQQNQQFLPGPGFGQQQQFGQQQFGQQQLGMQQFGQQQLGMQQFGQQQLGFQNPGMNFQQTQINNQFANYGSTGQTEPGKFYPVGLDTALNPSTGTILRPYSGVAFTNEGAFYRVPGTGNVSAFGTYVPGSGIYMNPFTGVAYNPQTGAIRRP